jgi:Flp pilus assembly protein TadG
MTPLGVRPSKRRRSRGQGLVEFALVVPLLLLLIFAVIDVGRAVFTFNTLSQSARSASRTALVNQERAKVRTSAISTATTLGLADANVSVCYKLEGSTARDCTGSTVDTCPRSQRVVGCLAIVVVSTTYHPLTPVIGQLFSSFAMSATSIVSIEYVCPARAGTVTTCT